MLQLADDITSGPLAKLTSSPLFTSLLESLRYCGEGVKREIGGRGRGWSMWDLQCSCVICPPIPSIPSCLPYPLCMSPTSLPFTIVTTFSPFSPHPPLLTHLLLTHTPLLTHLHSHLLPHPPTPTPPPSPTSRPPPLTHLHLPTSTYPPPLTHLHLPTSTYPPPLTHLHLPTSTYPPPLTHLHLPTSTYPPSLTPPCTHFYSHTSTHTPPHLLVLTGPPRYWPMPPIG